MANLRANNVQITYKNEHLIENFNQAESKLIFSWLEEILNEVSSETEVFERKLN